MLIRLSPSCVVWSPPPALLVLVGGAAAVPIADGVLARRRLRRFGEQVGTLAGRPHRVSRGANSGSNIAVL